MMLTGVSQILGFTPFNSIARPHTCEHEDDGYDYSEDPISRKIILRCDKCGEYYEEPRN